MTTGYPEFGSKDQTVEAGTYLVKFILEDDMKYHVLAVMPLVSCKVALTDSMTITFRMRHLVLIQSTSHPITLKLIVSLRH